MISNHKHTTLKQAVKYPLFFVFLMWSLHIIKVLGGFNWNIYGIHPREADGLIGILMSPLLHSGFKHLLSNTIPLFLMFTLISLFYSKVAKVTFIAIYLLTGISVWFLGRHVYHIGASGVVYGLISFVFWSGIFRKNFKSVILTIIIIFLYSGYIAGVFPGQEGISWESHLLGAIVGMLVAFIVRNVREQHEIDDIRRENMRVDNYEENYFFDRDIFEDKS